MRVKNFIVAFAIFMLASSTLQAEVIPGRWEIIERLESGTPITIKLKEGDRMECSLKTVDSEALELIDVTGQVITIPKSAVKEILGPAKEKDSNLDGTLCGLAIGGAGGLIYFAATKSRELDANASAGAWAAGIGLFGAGIGALTGYSIDYALKSRPVIYRAPKN